MIRRLRNSVDFMIPRLPLSRLVREIMCLFDDGLRITPGALLAIQTTTEAYLTRLMEDSGLLASHAGRKTIRSVDMYAWKRARHFLF